jgi:hypothetical protein
MLSHLIRAFSPELMAKEGKMDSDPHLWMPMTLSKESYVSLMGSKGVSDGDSSGHFDRIQNLLARMKSDKLCGGLGIFGAVTVGLDCCWWDYGQLPLYQKNLMLLTELSYEATLARLFYEINENSSRVLNSRIASTAFVDLPSSVCNSVIEAGNVKSSILSCVQCEYIDAEGCILINVTAKRIIARPGSIIYNYHESEERGIVVDRDQVLTGVSCGPGSARISIKSSATTDGGKSWKSAVHDNPYSFEQIYVRNQFQDVSEVERLADVSHSDTWKKIKNTRALTFSQGLLVGSTVVSIAAIFIMRMSK